MTVGAQPVRSSVRGVPARLFCFAVTRRASSPGPAITSCEAPAGAAAENWMSGAQVGRLSRSKGSRRWRSAPPVPSVESWHCSWRVTKREGIAQRRPLPRPSLSTTHARRHGISWSYGVNGPQKPSARPVALRRRAVKGRTSWRSALGVLDALRLPRAAIRKPTGPG